MHKLGLGLLAAALAVSHPWSAKAAPNCLRGQQPFELKGDTIGWEMPKPRGSECLQGIRWSYMQIFSVALASPPKFGKVEILGSGFRYVPNAASPQDIDTFKLHVLGKNRRDAGASTIEITVLPSQNPGSSFDEPASLRKAAVVYRHQFWL